MPFYVILMHAVISVVVCKGSMPSDHEVINSKAEMRPEGAGNTQPAVSTVTRGLWHHQ